MQKICRKYAEIDIMKKGQSMEEEMKKSDKKKMKERQIREEEMKEKQSGD